jgi:tetratricopeptide (TPR) repeat protein
MREDNGHRRLFKTLVSAARAALSSRKLDEAGQIVARLREAFPSEAASHGLALDLLLAEHRLDEADTLADHLVRRFPSSAGILFGAGMTAYRRRDYPRALKLFDESERLFTSRKTRRFMGKTLTNMGCFDDAESLLINLLSEYSFCRADLAWLYERKGDVKRALEHVSKHLAEFPNDRGAAAQKTRLEAAGLHRDEVLEQVEVLDDLGEPIPEELISQYVRSMVEAGESRKAREFVKAHLKEFERRTLISLAYDFHHLQLHDMAFELFLMVLEERSADHKVLTTIEYSARKADRIPELVAAYETLAPKQPALYTRVRKLAPPNRE